MRDDKWLFSKLDEVWDTYFPDVAQANDVQIIWGRRARNRLGSIKLNRNSKFENRNSNRHPETIITINSLFKDPKIPEFVVLGTIAHELAHYAHGFNSPHDQKYQTPHAGGVIHREMRSRGLDKIEKAQKKWLRENWREYLEEKLPQKRTNKRRVIIKWI